MTPVQFALFAVWCSLGAAGALAMLRLITRYGLARDTESAWMLPPGLFAAAVMYSDVDLGALGMFAGFSALAQTALGVFGALNTLHQVRKGLPPRSGSSR